MYPVTREDLRRTFCETAKTIESYNASSQARSRVHTEDMALREDGQRLLDGLYLLLPPRGPTSTVDCPHCGNPVRVTLSK